MRVSLVNSDLWYTQNSILLLFWKIKRLWTSINFFLSFKWRQKLTLRSEILVNSLTKLLNSRFKCNFIFKVLSLSLFKILFGYKSIVKCYKLISGYWVFWNFFSNCYFISSLFFYPLSLILWLNRNYLLFSGCEFKLYFH